MVKPNTLIVYGKSVTTLVQLGYPVPGLQVHVIIHAVLQSADAVGPEYWPVPSSGSTQPLIVQL